MKTHCLETKRTILKPFSVSDANEAYNNWTSDDNVSRYTPNEILSELTNNERERRHCSTIRNYTLILI